MSFKPEFNALSTWYQPSTHVPPFDLIADDVPCAYWFDAGRTRNRRGSLEPLVVGQLAVGRAHNYGAVGWSGFPPTFHPWDGLYVTIHDGAGFVAQVQPVSGGPMWLGTADEHWRFDVAMAIDATFAPLGEPPLYDQLDSAKQGRASTLSVYRPFGSGTLLEGNVPCYVYPGTRGPVSSNFAFNFPDFDYVLIVGDSVDIRDGNTRTVDVDGVAYHDGDEVRIPSGSGNSRFVVVRVERTAVADGSFKKRVFVLRDTAVWPGP